MSNKDIHIIIYSYKSKNIILNIKNILNNASGKYSIFINLNDQHQFDRSDQFSQLFENYDKLYSGVYSHIFWDHFLSPIKIINDKILNSKSKYVLILSDLTVLNKNWDVDFINFIDNKNIIISGNGIPVFSNKNIFYVNHETQNYFDFYKTQYISKNLIFGLRETFHKSMINGYILPHYLKYYGFEEVFSLQLFFKNIDIYSAPSDLCSINTYNQLEDFFIYVPFSKSHNYNEVIDLFKNGNNKYYNIDINKIKHFCIFHGFRFDLLSYLPYPKNDVSYSTQDSKFDKIGGRRFLDNIKQIN